MSAFIGESFKVPVTLNCELEQVEAMLCLLGSWGWLSRFKEPNAFLVYTFLNSLPLQDLLAGL